MQLSGNGGIGIVITIFRTMDTRLSVMGVDLTIGGCKWSIEKSLLPV